MALGRRGRCRMCNEGMVPRVLGSFLGSGICLSSGSQPLPWVPVWCGGIEVDVGSCSGSKQPAR